MFGPNARATALDHTRPFHHRGPQYRALLRDTAELFRAQFNIGEEFDVLFLTGSGTLANEAVLSSARGVVSVVPTGQFSSRLQGLVDAHAGIRALGATPWTAYVEYETALSQYCPPTPQMRMEKNGVVFADRVSSFPYYPTPPQVDVWTTVSSKQLGALPVLGIVVVRRAAWGHLRGPEEVYSYLNLSRWRHWMCDYSESPHTPAIPLLVDLHERLQIWDTHVEKDKIDRRREILMQAPGLQIADAHSEMRIPGLQSIGAGPVLTIPRSFIPRALARECDLYASAYGYQFFLYSGTDAEYEWFASRITGGLTNE